MFVDIVGASEKYTFKTVIRAFKADSKLMGMLPELHKLLGIVLTIPITTFYVVLKHFYDRRLDSDD